MTSKGSTFSILGPDVVVKGNIEALVDLHIDGKIEGDIRCASLVQGETSEITGKLICDTARISGLVRGTINVTELVVTSSARIYGDVEYEVLTLETGCVVEGQLHNRNTSDRAEAATLISDSESPVGQLPGKIVDDSEDRKEIPALGSVKA